LEAFLQDRAQDLVVAFRPVEVPAQAFEIDDVADEVQDVAARAAQEIEEQRGATGARSEMHVGYPHGPQSVRVLEKAHRLGIPRFLRARRVYRPARSERGRASQIGARD